MGERTGSGRSRRFWGFAAIVAAVALGGFTPAYGEARTEALVVQSKPIDAGKGVAVGYGDLDLASAYGSFTLKARLRGAVRQACHEAWMKSGDKGQAFLDRCRQNSLARAAAEAEQALARARAPKWARR